MMPAGATPAASARATGRFGVRPEGAEGGGGGVAAPGEGGGGVTGRHSHRRESTSGAAPGSPGGGMTPAFRSGARTLYAAMTSRMRAWTASLARATAARATRAKGMKYCLASCPARAAAAARRSSSASAATSAVARRRRARSCRQRARGGASIWRARPPPPPGWRGRRLARPPTRPRRARRGARPPSPRRPARAGRGGDASPRACAESAPSAGAGSRSCTSSAPTGAPRAEARGRTARRRGTAPRRGRVVVAVRAVALAAPERRERAAHVAQRALVGKRPRGHRRAKLRRERRERRDHRAAPHPAVDCRAGRDSAHSSRYCVLIGT